MTSSAQPRQNGKNSTRYKALKTPRIYIDPNDFYLMRRRASLDVKQAAQALDVTEKTIQNWEKGRVRIPYTAYRVIKIKAGYVFDDKYFKDWFVRGDTLWSPENRGFKPHELRYIANYFWMARRWLAERRASKDFELLKATIARGAASNGSPTLRAGTLPSCGAAPLHEPPPKLERSYGLQERPPEFEAFLHELGIL